MAVVGYARVSTDRQDTENQKSEIQRWCAYEKIEVTQWVCETITTRKKDREIFQLINNMHKGDTLIVTELSRIGRTLTEVLGLIDILMSKEIRVVVIKEKFDICDDNPMGMLMIHVVGAFYQFERSMNSKRTKAVIESKRAIGISVGRPYGAKGKKRKLDGKESKIKEYLDKGMKKTEIARMLDVDRTVLYDKLAEMGVKSDV